MLLDSRLDGLDDEANKVDRFIDRCVEDVQEFILQNDSGYIDFEDISETQNTIINKAAMIQAEWILANGDFRNQSGYDAINNTYTALSEVKKRHIAPKAKSLLLSKIICRVR